MPFIHARIYACMQPSGWGVVLYLSESGSFQPPLGLFQKLSWGGANTFLSGGERVFC